MNIKTPTFLSRRTSVGIAIPILLFLVTGFIIAIGFYLTGREEIQPLEPEQPVVATTSTDSTGRTSSPPSSSTPPPPMPNNKKPTEDAGAATCRAEGGRWMLVGLEGTYQCIHRYPDAGKPCSSSQECTGGCIITDQQSASFCKEDDNPFGCYATIEDFHAGRGIMCID